eukprot:3127394-Prymnesium_polylepis.1
MAPSVGLGDHCHLHDSLALAPPCGGAAAVREAERSQHQGEAAHTRHHRIHLLLRALVAARRAAHCSWGCLGFL